ncbi:MAG: PAS domain S-box protein [Negativicutes bacterium]
MNFNENHRKQDEHRDSQDGIPLPQETVATWYRSVFEHHQTVMLIINPGNGRIMHANRAAADYYGWDLNELLQKNITEINTLSAEAVFTEMGLARSQKRNYFQFKHRLADGRIRDVESRSTPISWGDQILLCSMVTDVTERNRTERELKEAKENMETLVALRTEELTAMNEELHAMNEELTAQNEEIATLNQNLQDLNQTLEARVENRTLDLSAAHQELIAQYGEIQKNQLALQHGAEIQTALREIADASLTASSLTLFYESVHNIVQRVMCIDNIYITLRDDDAGTIVRPYSMGATNTVPRRRSIGKGWTEYVMRMGRAVHFSPEERQRLCSAGELELTIENCHEWLGAPLHDSQGVCFGVIAVFSTDASKCFKTEDKDLLSIIAAQISLAIQRKQTEEALTTNERRLKKAQTMARVGNWELDIASKRIWASDESYRIYGLSREAGYLPLQAIQEVVCKEDRPRLDKALKRLLAGKEKYDMEFKIFRRDTGFETIVHSIAEVEYDASGKPVKILGVIQDITERQRIERVLAESEARYKAVMEQAPEAVFICDPDTGEIMEANSRFTDRFGYDLYKDGPLTVFDLSVDKQKNIDGFLAQVKRDGFLPLQRQTMRHRNGTHVQVERSATLVRYRDRSLLVQTIRDVSDEIRREQEIRRDAELATRVQNALLKEAEPSEHLKIVTVFEPHSYVGGDLYFMDWRYDGSLLRGFLVDASGHGLATALHTSAMHVLLREVNELDLPLQDQMRWLNRRAGQYFDDATFAGALGFELDLQMRQLRWSCAGMPLVWLATRDRQGMITCPGMYLGICSVESFEMHTAPLTEGDSVCFMTDGLSEIFGRNPDMQPVQYDDMVDLLREIVLSEECHDDATAICIQVKSLPHSSVRQNGWPRILRFNGYGDYQRLKGEIGKILMEVTGKEHSLQEVAVHEALANAMECRDGVPRQHRARLRVNQVGNRLIVRVKTSRIGFAGNAMLRRLRANPRDMFSFGKDAGMGRGIPIMLSAAHRMTYNSEGTEVLLFWKLDKIK